MDYTEIIGPFSSPSKLLLNLFKMLRHVFGGISSASNAWKGLALRTENSLSMISLILSGTSMMGLSATRIFPSYS